MIDSVVHFQTARKTTDFVSSSASISHNGVRYKTLLQYIFMCRTEIRHFYSCSNHLLTMSSNSNSPQNPPAEEGGGGKNEETLQLQETASPETAEKITDPIDDKQKGKEIIDIVAVDDRKDHAVAGSTKVVSSSSSDPKKELVSGEGDDGEGFKTPTSSDHKIPAITQCPPAPIKPRPPKLLKRKASPPSGARRSLQYDDSSTEVESIFRPLTSDQRDNVEEQESKRAKNNDDEDRRRD